METLDYVLDLGIIVSNSSNPPRAYMRLGKYGKVLYCSIASLLFQITYSGFKINIRRKAFLKSVTADQTV